MNNFDVRSTIQAEMRAAFPVAEERVAQYYGMQSYHLGWCDTGFAPAAHDPGKLLRPQLALLACRTVGGAMQTALPLAAGIQLIHDFSLIHDDIQDQSDTRRGRITVWKEWGLAHGINAGDGMFVIAHLALHRLAQVETPQGGVPAATILEVLRRFDETILTICEGQYLDLSFEGDLSITEDDYLAMIRRKTAVLIACAAGLGALVGGGDSETVESFFALGEAMGVAFQIEDDILGIWGDPEVTGKPRAADVYRRKVSLPIVHALRNTTNDDLHHLYQQETLSDREVQHVLHILEETQSRAATEQLAATYHEQTKQALAHIRSSDTPDSQAALADIHALIERLIGRQA
jgi:geranylgeranyl diphosphate synthase type I